MRTRPTDPNKNGRTSVRINESERRVVRAGSVNLLILAIPIYLVLVVGVFKDIGVDVVVKYAIIGFVQLLGVCLFLKVYMSYVSRLDMLNKELHVVCSLQTIIINYEDIDYVRIHSNPVFGVTKIKIKQKGRSSFRVFRITTFDVKEVYVPDVVPTLKQMMADFKVHVQ